MSQTNFDKLHRVQNTLARVVTGTTRFNHITPILEKLHWLPIKSRVSFKLATLAFKTRQSGEPGYLPSLLQPYQSTRELRSSSKDLLVVTTTKLGFGLERSAILHQPRGTIYLTKLNIGTICRLSGKTSRPTSLKPLTITELVPPRLRLVSLHTAH